MGIFSRFSDIMNANINSILDRAEDPEKMVRLMIQEMEETLIEVRSSAVKSIADKKEIMRQVEKLKAGQKEWTDKAEFAISKGREDLAKAALVARRRIEDQYEVLEVELATIEESLARYNDDLSRLQAKLDEAKTKRKSVEVRMKTAQKRVRVRQTLHDGRIDEALTRYEILERRIDELEADADSYDLGRDGAPSLDQEFADLEAESGIEDELSRLKAKAAKNKKAS